jgi:hypothetical protein
LSRVTTRLQNLYEEVSQAEAHVTLAISYLDPENIEDPQRLREIRNYLQDFLGRIRDNMT